MAGYVDRMLKGEKPTDWPIEVPTKKETVLNMTPARAIGLEVPTSILQRADEVIEYRKSDGSRRSRLQLVTRR
jgi:putative ABC transport system substrate-binding protein